MKNEIITFGTNYKLNNGIKTIVQSAKNTSGKLTVIGVDLDAETIEYIEANNGTHINGRELSEKHNIDLTLSPYTLKVIFYTLYCKKYSKSENVFICDFTDVFFQRDIFYLVDEEKITVHSELEKIATCDTNSTWINTCFGQNVYNNIKDNEIINSGTFFGKREKINILLDKLCTEIIRALSYTGNYLIIDQPAMNKLVYEQPDIFKVRRDNKVYNLAHNTDTHFKVEEDIISLNGYDSYVLHQYDVNPELKKFIYDKIT